MATKNVTLKVCGWCKSEFILKPRKGASKYCSAYCLHQEHRHRQRKRYKPANHPERDCIQCGASYKPKAKHTRLCGSSCRSKYSWAMKLKARVPLTPKQCIQCGAEFTPGSRNYKRAECCSIKCRQIVTDRTEIECACGYCGKTFKRLRQGLGLYCSYECTWAANHRAAMRRYSGTYTAIEWHECRVCGDVLSQRPGANRTACELCLDEFGTAANTSSVEFLMVRSGGRECEVCGDVFTPFMDRMTTCSKECYRKTDRYRYAQSTTKAKRRARMKTNGPYENINPFKIFQRDDWTCYLCGDETPSRLRGTCDPKAPEMDHVIPLAKGGKHVHDNVACSCRECNQRKSDNIVTMMFGMPLINSGIEYRGVPMLTPLLDKHP